MHIANSKASNSTKQKLANCYNYYCITNHINWKNISYALFCLLADAAPNTFIRVSQSTFQGCFHHVLYRENQETVSAIASAICIISHRHNYPVIIDCALILAESIAAERLRK